MKSNDPNLKPRIWIKIFCWQLQGLKYKYNDFNMISHLSKSAKKD